MVERESYGFGEMLKYVLICVFFSINVELDYGIKGYLFYEIDMVVLEEFKGNKVD